MKDQASPTQPIEESGQLPAANQLGIVFRIDPESNELWADFNPTEATRELTKQQFMQVFARSGFNEQDFPLVPAALATLLDAIRRKVPKDICLSLPVDARVDIFLSPNRLVAGMVLHGAQGMGKPIDREQIDILLRKNKVTRGLLEDALTQLTDPALAEKLRNTQDVYCTVIAFGETSVNGQDGFLEPLVHDASDRRPQLDDYDRVDFLELGDFPYIEEGTPMMRRHPPEKGKDGWTVTGKVLRGKDGKDIQLRIKDASVRPDPEDENLLVAAVSGLPVIYDKGAQVEQLLKLNQVDLSTGHIRFRGSVEIKGDVRDGMQVIATGDIKIGGVVDAAFIKTDGHIEVLGGAIGHKDAVYLTEKAALKAGCSIKARFAHEALLEAGHEIIISNQVMHSSLTAGTFVEVQGKGQIVGGQVKAVDLIKVNTTGAVAYSETRLEVGQCQELQEEYTQLLAQLHQLDEQKYKLVELARKTKQQGREQVIKMKDQLLRAKESLQARYKELNQQLMQTEEQLRRFYAAKVEVNRRAYPGTFVTIAGKSYEVRKELDKVSFFLQDGKIHTHQ
ncbi:FapA family protein [Marinospirillum sp. MEB164]|uniref:FapA family protein n=1 Tax=Marinospirillum alkalitolerans TaxID=3123374 RepID=A0ABW8PWQ8_9GAMM